MIGDTPRPRDGPVGQPASKRWRLGPSIATVVASFISSGYFRRPGVATLRKYRPAPNPEAQWNFVETPSLKEANTP